MACAPTIEWYIVFLKKGFPALFHGTKHTRFKSFTVQHYVFEVRPLNEQRSVELNATPVTESDSTASEVPPETSRNVSNPDDIGANIDCMNSR